MRFKAQGHRNVLATHKTTLEFTKDSHLTKRGDCILGVKSDFPRPEGLDGRIRIRIKIGELSEVITAFFNPGFDSDEMVIRKSDFKDRRTFATGADKAAIDIDREIVNRLKNPDILAYIEINNY